MKKSLFILIIVAIFTNSCEKEKVQKAIPEAIYIGCKTNYIDFAPDSLFRMPVLDYKIYSLDLDYDSQNDLLIKCDNKLAYFGPHKYDEYNIEIEGINNVQFTLSYNQLILEGSFINSKLPYSSSLKILTSPGGTMQFTSEKGFIGFRKFVNGSYYYGWMRIEVINNNLLMYDLAINKCKNKAIKVGYHR